MRPSLVPSHPCALVSASERSWACVLCDSTNACLRACLCLSDCLTVCPSARPCLRLCDWASACLRVAHVLATSAVQSTSAVNQPANQPACLP
eukprot:5344479-Alexandrium_andersonii.AAC.1